MQNDNNASSHEHRIPKSEIQDSKITQRQTQNDLDVNTKMKNAEADKLISNKNQDLNSIDNNLDQISENDSSQ